METQAGPLAKRDREKLFDHNSWTSVRVPGGEGAALTLRLLDGSVKADRVTLTGRADVGAPDPCLVTLEVSRDGENWMALRPLRENLARNFQWIFDLPAVPMAALTKSLNL